MSPEILAIIVTAAIAVLALLYTIVRWMRARSARNLLQGLALILLPVGLYITGVMNLLVNGVNSLVDWYNRIQPPSTLFWVGAALAGLGVVLFVAGTFVRPIGRQEAAERRATRQGVPDQTRATASSGRPAVTTTQATKPGPAAGAKRDSALSDEDLEVMNILKSRGIE